MASCTINAADLFCGGGGTSTGLARACARSGKKLDLVAVNHWDLAIETHRKNHPEARHVCSSLDGLNPRDLVPGGRLKILVASPECTHHSSARGGRPMNDQSRASAWLILKWLQELYVESILIENVPEFEHWGPLGANGKPMKSKRGTLFAQFLENLRTLGYAVDWKILNAANYGDPTTRQRLFIIGTRFRRKPVWPEPTHAAVGKTETFFGSLKPWRAAREVIDWSIPGKSIFGRKKPLAMNTLKRILAGMQKFKWPEPFIVVLRRHMAARSVNDPLPTVTAGGMHLGLCEPFVLQQQSGGVPRSIDRPIPTVAAGGAISLIMANRNHNVPRSVDEPIPALCTGNHMYKVDPFVVPYRGERRGQRPRTHGIDQPLPAVTTENGHALVEPFILTASHGDGASRRCKSIHEPLPTITTANDHAVIEPMILKIDHQGTGPGRARSLENPLPTITTKNGLGIVSAAPCIIEMRNGKTANSLDEPLSTVTSLGAHHALLTAEPFLDKYYGSGVAADLAEPLDTITAKARFGLCQVGDALFDIHFRMLRPRELARAQGFPDSYEFSGGSADATKLIGNAVPVNLAEALCLSLLSQ